MYPLSNWMAALLNCRQNFSLQMWGNDDNRARRNLSSDTILVKVFHILEQGSQKVVISIYPY